METIFKEGDRVYFHVYGWGKIFDIDVNVGVKFENLESYKYFNIELLKALSFTEYTLEGFSQERPEELPKKGQIVWGRDEDYQSWHIYHFSHKTEDGIYHLSSDNKRNMYQLKQITTENPYANEQ
jgi:hypothetical protein